jgi:hypothetical protein
MQRRKKPMRSPFVVTISVAAVAAASLASVACGGKVPTDGIGSSGSSGSSGTSGSSGSSGTSGSLNPPAPVSCTSSTRAGDPCSPSYASECFDGANGAALFCVEGTWTEQEIPITNPPAPQPQCPETAPAEGSACNSYSAGACSYVDGCSARPSTAPPDKTFVCNGGAWKRSSGSYVAACPATPPSPGDSCATCAGSYPANCTYTSNGSGCPGPTAVCDPTTSTWNLAISSCNPPALDAGVP